MVFEKPRDYGNRKETRNFEIWNSSTKASWLISSRVTSTQAYGSCPKVSTSGIPPFDHSLRSDEWTARLHDHHVLGYVGVYVDDLLIAGPRFLHDSMIQAVQGVWKTSAPELLGTDPDCVPVLRLLGMNLETSQ